MVNSVPVVVKPILDSIYINLQPTPNDMSNTEKKNLKSFFKSLFLKLVRIENACTKLISLFRLYSFLSVGNNVLMTSNKMGHSFVKSFRNSSKFKSVKANPAAAQHFSVLN